MALGARAWDKRVPGTACLMPLHRSARKVPGLGEKAIQGYVGTTVSDSADLGGMRLSYWLQVSERLECSPGGPRASSSLLLLSLNCLPAGMSAGWGFSQQGLFPVRAADSSWSLGTAPTWVRATERAGRVPGQSQLLCS